MITHLMLVTGAPGSGKSHLVGTLLVRYGCVGLFKDDIKDVLLQVLGSDGPAASRRLSDASFALQFALAARVAPRNGILLLEGNFRPGEHEGRVAELIEPGVTRFLQVLCHVAEPIRRERLRARAQAHLRHPGHEDEELAERPAASAFLDLPGTRLSYDSGATDDLIGIPATLLAALDQWRFTSSTSA